MPQNIDFEKRVISGQSPMSFFASPQKKTGLTICLSKCVLNISMENIRFKPQDQSKLLRVYYRDSAGGIVEKDIIFEDYSDLYKWICQLNSQC